MPPRPEFAKHGTLNIMRQVSQFSPEICDHNAYRIGGFSSDVVMRIIKTTTLHNLKPDCLNTIRRSALILSSRWRWGRRWATQRHPARPAGSGSARAVPGRTARCRPAR